MEFLEKLSTEYLTEYLIVGTVAVAAVVLAFIYAFRLGIGFLNSTLMPMLREITVLRETLAAKQQDYYEKIERENQKSAAAIVVRLDQYGEKLTLLDKGVQDLDDILALHNVTAEKRHSENRKRFDNLDGTTDKVLALVKGLPAILHETQTLIGESEKRITEAQGKQTDKILEVLENVRVGFGQMIMNMTRMHTALATVEDQIKLETGNNSPEKERTSS